MVDVFISYAAADAEIAARVRAKLSEKGITTWMDIDLKPGEDASSQIHDALFSAASGLVLLSPAAANSPDVAREYKTILLQNKRLYVAVIKPVSSGSRDTLYQLQSQNSIDLSKDFDQGVAELIRLIQSPESLYSRPEVDVESAQIARRRSASVKVEVNFHDLDDSKRDALISLVKELTEAGIEEIRVVDVNVG